MARFRAHNASSSLGVNLLCIVLIVSVVVLTLIGLVMVYSASSASLVSTGGSVYSKLVVQAVCTAIGVVCAIVVWIAPYRLWVGRAVWIVWGVAIVLLVLTALFGVEENGAKRWFSIGELTVQPSEFVKIALLLMAVRIVYDVRSGISDLIAGIVQGLVFILVPLVALYATQSDLGTTLVCAVAIFAVMWLGGVSRRVLAVIAAVGVVFVIVAVAGSGYRSSRLVFLNPWNDGEDGYGSGYQIIRALYAFAEGGIFGVGLGGSHEKYQYLYASESDYIFAIIGEELGLIGALFVIVLFLAMIYAGLRISQASPDECGYMIGGGCTIMLAFQAFLNIGCSMGILPTTGKPLPFVSSGGSSIIASMIMIGLILSVARETSRPSVYEQRRADLRIVRVQGSRDSRNHDDPAGADTGRRRHRKSDTPVGRGGYDPGRHAGYGGYASSGGYGGYSGFSESGNYGNYGGYGGSARYNGYGGYAGSGGSGDAARYNGYGGYAGSGNFYSYDEHGGYGYRARGSTYISSLSRSNYLRR